MSFEKNKKSNKDALDPNLDIEAQFAAAANIAAVEAPLAEVQKRTDDTPVEAASFDPHKLVEIIPRLGHRPGGSMAFTVADRTYQIQDNKRARVPMDVAIQLREKGYCAGFGADLRRNLAVLSLSSSQRELLPRGSLLLRRNTMSAETLVQELRDRIKDVRSVVRAFGISVRDAAATSAVVEVSQGRLKVTVVGGTTGSLDLSLSDPAYSTLGALERAVASVSGYVVSRDAGMDATFSSVDLTEMSAGDCLGRQIDITHRLFSDQWLRDILRRALMRHNPSMPSVDRLPVGEEELVLTLARSMILTEMATDSSRRRGLTMTTDELLRISKALEDSYKFDMTRLARAIQSPREASSNIMREGDVVVGRFGLRRRGGRTSRGNIPPETPHFVDGPDSDIEDTKALIRWERSADSNFASYQLWRGTDEGVEKDRGLYVLTTYSNVNNERDALATTGGWVTGLEPGTDYFFRLYVIDRNGEFTGSEVMQVTTLPIRVLVDKVNTVLPASATTGDVVTVLFDSNGSPPSTSMTVFVGEKQASFTVTGMWEIEVTVPAIYNKGPKDIVVRSPLISCVGPLEVV